RRVRAVHRGRTGPTVAEDVDRVAIAVERCAHHALPEEGIHGVARHVAADLALGDEALITEVENLAAVGRETGGEIELEALRAHRLTGELQLEAAAARRAGVHVLRAGESEGGRGLAEQDRVGGLVAEVREVRGDSSV